MVRTVCSISQVFDVVICMRRGSRLSLLLFALVMEASSRQFPVGLPWELLRVDNLAVRADREVEVIGKLDVWREGLEKKGLRVNLSNTKLMTGGERHNTKKTVEKWPRAVCGCKLDTVH